MKKFKYNHVIIYIRLTSIMNLNIYQEDEEEQAEELEQIESKLKFQAPQPYHQILANIWMQKTVLAKK